jgi:hypothetical protein
MFTSTCNRVIQDNIICACCGRKDEGVVFIPKRTWKTLWLVKDIPICESCICKIFKSFDPAK